MNDKNRSLFLQERKAKILELLTERKKITVSELCDIFMVSGGTIRSDLNDLDASGLLVKTHGGAIQKTKAAFEPKAEQREVDELTAKQLIAKEALKLVEDGDAILLDAGTTVFEFAKKLSARKNLYIVTSDLHTADYLHGIEGMNTFMIGGHIRPGFHCVVGRLGVGMLASITVDTAFMCTNSFSVSKGATSPDIQQAEIRKTMSESAARVVLLCDRTKIGKTSFAQSIPIDRIDVLITDFLSPDDKTELEEVGIRVIIASQDNRSSD